MKQKNLDELRNIYLGLVTGGEGLELLSEASNATAAGGGEAAISALIRQGISPGQARTKINYAGAGELKRQSSASATNKSLQSGQSVSVNTSAGSGLIGRLGLNPQQGKLNSKGELEVKGTNSNFAQDKTIRLGGKGYNRLTAADGSVKYVPGKASTPLKVQPKPVDPKSSEPPVDAGSSGNGSSGNSSSGNSSSGNSSSGNSSSGPTRPAASGPVLSKLKGVEGTGVGANFKAKAFTDTEKTRYSSVAAAKPTIPTGTTAGGTTFQRRTPTSAELGAAQASRAAGGSEESAIKAGVGASKPVAPVGDKFGTTSTIKPPSPTQVKSDTPTTQLTKMQPSSSDNSGETDRLKKALDIKKSDVTSSYQFPMSKTLRDLSDSYNEIYEAKKKLDLVGQEDDDIDNDGDIDKSDKYLLNRRKVRSKAIGEATAMSKRGYDEVPIRNKIAAKTSASGAGSFADKATALADKETYGDKKRKKVERNLLESKEAISVIQILQVLVFVVMDISQMILK